MTTRSTTVRQNAIYAIVACLAMASATAAFAVPPKQVLQIATTQTFTGQCCKSFGETVSVTEPAAVVPVIVSFSGDFFLDTHQGIALGIMVNGGACQTSLGPSALTELGSNRGFDSSSWDYIVLPGDGLRPGKNTFTLCGGGAFDTSKLSLGFNTLSVRMSK